MSFRISYCRTTVGGTGKAQKYIWKSMYCVFSRNTRTDYGKSNASFIRRTLLLFYGIIFYYQIYCIYTSSVTIFDADTFEASRKF